MSKHCRTCVCRRITPSQYPCTYCKKMHKRKNVLLFCSIKCHLLGSIKVVDECHLWQGRKTSHRYGSIVIKGEEKTVHRLAFELFKQPIRPRHFVSHTCDNRTCINPQHLFEVSAFDDVRKRMKARKLWDGGKLDKSDILEIRTLYATGSYDYKDLASKFNVTSVNIGLIVRRKTWKAL